MKIAYIGWGSLIWKQGSLKLRGTWQSDGPYLPVEFARVSQDGRLTLVLCRGVSPVQTLWAYAEEENLNTAQIMVNQISVSSDTKIIDILLSGVLK